MDVRKLEAWEASGALFWTCPYWVGREQMNTVDKRIRYESARRGSDILRECDAFYGRWYYYRLYTFSSLSRGAGKKSTRNSKRCESRGDNQIPA